MPGAAGRECPQCQRGQSTWCPGKAFYGSMHAEFFLTGATACLPIPDDVPDEVAVLLPGDGLGVPYHTSRKLADDRVYAVAVYGLGPVGLDREGLERLCRYVNRPPLAYGRLRQLDSGDLAFALKTPWEDGTSHLVFGPLEFIGRLAALTPPPRLHLIRYHGVLAPHVADRALIVPGTSQAPPAHVPPSTRPTPPRPSRLRWANLLARVFLADALQCPRCGARRHWVAALTDPHSIGTYLTGVGLPAERPPIAPPRPPPQQAVAFSS